MYYVKMRLDYIAIGKCAHKKKMGNCCRRILWAFLQMEYAERGGNGKATKKNSSPFISVCVVCNVVLMVLGGNNHTHLFNGDGGEGGRMNAAPLLHDTRHKQWTNETEWWRREWMDGVFIKKRPKTGVVKRGMDGWMDAKMGEKKTIAKKAERAEQQKKCGADGLLTFAGWRRRPWLTGKSVLSRFLASSRKIGF